MRIWMAGLLAAAVALSAGCLHAAEHSEGFDEIVRLAEAGTGEDVLLAYIENSQTAYNPNVDEILLLHDLGISSKVITAMIDRGRKLRLEAAQAAEVPAPAPAPVREPDPVVIAPRDPEPQPLPADARPAYEYQQPEPERVVSSVPTTQVVYEAAPSSVVYVPPSDSLNISYFYNSLSPYGRWMLLPNYGWVWQPTVVRINPGWRPYFDSGRWVWTNHGWYWYSNYSWGWAPFHYGRWDFVPGYGWVWSPDTVWGPAWVHWRRSPDYCGWAPLPRGSSYHVGIGFTFHGKNVDISFGFNLSDRDYAFVPTNRFRSNNLAPVALPRQQVTKIYNNTTTINNTYIYNDNRIINNGVPVDSVAAASNEKIAPIQVADASASAGDAIAGQQLKNDRIVAFRPRIADQTPDDPRQAVARRQAFQRRWQEEEKAIETQVETQQADLAKQGVSREEARRNAERDARRRVFQEVAKQEIKVPPVAPATAQPSDTAKPAGTQGSTAEGTQTGNDPRRRGEAGRTESGRTETGRTETGRTEEGRTETRRPGDGNNDDRTRRRGPEGRTGDETGKTQEPVKAQDPKVAQPETATKAGETPKAGEAPKTGETATRETDEAAKLEDTRRR
ncbi:MAG: hypothetical protein KIS92_25070, partial [Planctomycetota bacterium]|nr:hypothetical protein [Planctomycetota bacterium]